MRELHFPSSYRNGVAHFLDFGGKNILVGRNLKNGRLANKKLILLRSRKITFVQQ